MNWGECLQLLQQCLWAGLQYFARLLNSSFAIALVGALAGAFAGAVGAQRVIERGKIREELLKELRNTNAAIMVSATICNIILKLKSQIVKPLTEKFSKDRAAYLTVLAQEPTDQKPGSRQFRFDADLTSFPSPILPTQTLSDLVFDKISAYGKCLSLVSMITDAATGLSSAVATRETLISHLGQGALQPDVFASFYFGEQTTSGNRQGQYADTLDVIHSYCNDLIFFSSELCADLVQHGNCQRKEFEKQFGNGAPAVTAVDFSGAKNAGLFPPDSDYTSWSRWFTEHTPEESRMNARKRGRGRRGQAQ